MTDLDLALQVRGVAKRFDSVVAVDDVSFDLGGDELLALVGPSGCGKSTLLRTIAGLHHTETGSITLGGVLVDDGRRTLPPEQRRVGLVFQEHALFPHLTVAKNVAFGVRDGDPTGRVAEMLDMVGLGRFGDRYPHELSGGERQRVALARAMAPAPSLMLLDEPFASLDPNLRTQIRDDVVDILRATGTPALFVTHDQNEALAVGDRVAVMRDGRIVQIDAPERVFHLPADRFVAAFMGEADFLSAGEARRSLGAAELVADDDQPVMVRPDDIIFEPSILMRDAAIVVSREFRGSTWCYTLGLASGATVRATRSHLDRIDVGTAVDVSMAPGHSPVPIADDSI